MALLLAVLMIVGIVPVTALAEEAPPQVSVVVYYEDESGASVMATSYVASLNQGNDYSGSHTLPSFDDKVIKLINLPEGVTRNGNQLRFALTNVQTDIEIHVVYKNVAGTANTYTVLHYQQNLNDNDYTLAETELAQTTPRQKPIPIFHWLPVIFRLRLPRTAIRSLPSIMTETATR